VTDVTNEELGRWIGLTHSGVSRLLAGERTPSTETMVAISAVFGVDPGEVLKAATQCSDDSIERATRWGRWFTQLVRGADLDAIRERMTLASATG
jgi:transcriptional regulator with XRE-family HTH domain